MFLKKLERNVLRSFHCRAHLAFGSMRNIVQKLTDDRQIDFAVARRRLLEINSASVNSRVALANLFQGELRGCFGVLEEGTFFQALILPVIPMFQAVPPSRVETATRINLNFIKRVLLVENYIYFFLIKKSSYFF